ncbi:hypothetical protein KBX50_05275 [Micromonospora sp. C51]|uniref:hypothetical protein n=1 Tax=Micromonospora sp. C51 TaxID=2824879 RepID=UPI001B3880A1|nr:hypothetical protein [Micromonospora sp. C51]MBQ1047870.1 hypothetical protein [Micromonospora sp. C51]
MSDVQPTSQSLLVAFLRAPDSEDGECALVQLLARGFTARDLLACVERLEAVFADPGQRGE